MFSRVSTATQVCSGELHRSHTQDTCPTQTKRTVSRSAPHNSPRNTASHPQGEFLVCGDSCATDPRSPSRTTHHSHQPNTSRSRCMLMPTHAHAHACSCTRRLIMRPRTAHRLRCSSRGVGLRPSRLMVTRLTFGAFCHACAAAPFRLCGRGGAWKLLALPPPPPLVGHAGVGYASAWGPCGPSRCELRPPGVCPRDEPRAELGLEPLQTCNGLEPRAEPLLEIASRLPLLERGVRSVTATREAEGARARRGGFWRASRAWACVDARAAAPPSYASSSPSSVIGRPSAAYSKDCESRCALEWRTLEPSAVTPCSSL